MNASELRALRRLARLQGIQLSYVSASGETREASPEALLGVLAALGCLVDSARDIPERLDELEEAERGRPLPRIIVAWDEQKTRVRARRAKGRPGPMHLRLTLEDGSRKTISLDRARRENAIDATGAIDLPGLPPGYHELELETRDGAFRSLVISAPRRSYTPLEETRRTGVFLPLYAAHSRTSWGAGNIGDWERLGTWAAAHGVAVGAALPLLATFLDQPVFEPSPYSPASRLFWSEFYIDIERVSEFASNRKAQRCVQSPAFQKRLRAFRRSTDIDYIAEMKARREILEILAADFFRSPSPRRAAFEQFRDSRPDLDDYAAFRSACERAGRSWHSWADRARDGELRPSDYDPAALQYHAYAQWLMQEQMTGLIERSCGRGINLYLDLPLGVHPDSYDVWRQRALFTLRASAGAPPDPFFSKGQDWGFAPLHPQASREQGYRYVLDYLRFQMRHTGMLRIDHVMGLHRLYWIPHGLAATDGAYVSYPADELYALLSLESHRHKTVLVGENLGTVPPEVNRSMKTHQLRRMYVVQFEQRPSAQAALSPPPVASVASLNTHDMPTFAAHWHGADIQDRADLGLISRGELGKERRQRVALKNALVRFLRKSGFLPKRGRVQARDALRACLEWLGASPAEVILINLEDLWLERRPQNVPGTSSERPNWRRKAQLTVEEIEANEELAGVLDRVRQLRGSIKPKPSRPRSSSRPSSP